MLAIAEAFLTLFEEESEDDIYWLFSNFIKKLESQIILKEELVRASSYVSKKIMTVFCYSFFALVSFWKILIVFF